MELLALKQNVYSENYTPQFVHISRSFSVLTLLYVTDNLLNCSWGSQGKNTEVVCHSLLQWTTFWIFIGRTYVEAETPILWLPDVKSWLSGKDPDTGKDWRQEEKGMTEDSMVGWHHRLDGHEFEQVSRVGDGQGSLACCSPRGHQEPDMAGWGTYAISRSRLSL